MTATTCEHLLAEQIPPDQITAELPGVSSDAIVFACFECGNYLDESGELLQAESSESNAPKAPAPSKTGRNRNEPVKNEPEPKRHYRRDPSHKIEVGCKVQECRNRWKVWPQNVDQAQYCPQLHKPLIKIEQGRARQRRFRAAQKQ